MKTSYVVFVIAAVVIIGGGAVWYVSQNSISQQPSAQQPPAAQLSKTVTIANFSFQPSGVTVSSGTIVTWTNNDGVPHTVTADDGSFDSGSISPGGTFSRAFAVPGDYAYHCKFHGSMHGSVMITK